MPSRLTLAQIEDLIARDEAQLAAYRREAAEAEAEGLDPDHARGLARFVEERLAVLRRARQARLSGEQPEPGPEQRLR
jgi:hypothetical protein